VLIWETSTDKNNMTQEDREMAILLVAYPERMRIAQPEDLLALFEFILEDDDDSPERRPR
jgi:hypothetical protein